MTAPLARNQNFVCCDYSQQVGEPLFATATRVDVWWLLEERQPWGKEAFAESGLLAEVKNHLTSALNAVSGSRLQLIRQPSRRPDEAISFFVAKSGEHGSTLYRFELATYEELLDLDLPGIAAGDGRYQSYLTDSRVLLVCVNGKRDVSCAKYGAPVYETLSQLAPGTAWQTTHLGGHRFAATSVFLPHGLCYGRLTPEQVPDVVEEYRRDRIILEAYRGRSFYDEPLQAADYFLRQKTDNRAINGLRLIEAHETQNRCWRVSFESLPDRNRYIVDIEQFASDFKVYKSSTDKEPVQVPQYRLFDYQLLAR
jgi:hypothetical protein